MSRRIYFQGGRIEFYKALGEPAPICLLDPGHSRCCRDSRYPGYLSYSHGFRQFHCCSCLATNRWLRVWLLMASQDCYWHLRWKGQFERLGPQTAKEHCYWRLRWNARFGRSGPLDYVRRHKSPFLLTEIVGEDRLVGEGSKAARFAEL